MKINRTILSIPPHISTSWKNIIALQLQQNSMFQQDLVITLLNNSTITIPNLDEKTINEIFTAHAAYLEQDSQIPSFKNFEPKSPHSFNPNGGSTALSFGFPFKMKELEGMGNFGGLMQHNPEQSDAPSLPEEMLKKIGGISKVMGLDNQLENIPKAEPHCNCPYCQIARALHDEPTTAPSPEPVKEESISDDELKFREWDLQEIGKDLYEVRNPLDLTEHYQVFIGSPIGCTCGCKNCEHIKAVLNS